MTIEKKTQKPKILMIGFGGTIAMTESPNGLVATESVEDLIKLVPALEDSADLDFIQVENEDSTNIGPAHWSKLIMEVTDNHDKYDGILITHGTDTMAYTATALSFGLGKGLKIPIVITGSQLPLTTFKTDARSNLERSLDALVLAAEENIAEVLVVFDDMVLRGNRTIKASESYFGAFDSPAFSPLARITATGTTFSILARKKDENFELQAKPQFDQNIISIELVPGLKPSMLRSIIRGGECHGLLLKSLGAGNVPTLDEYSVIPIIEEATKNNIPVLILTKFVGGNVHADIYEVGQAALKAGVIPTGDLTDVAAQVKFMWALAQGYTKKEELEKFINTDFVGEISEVS